MTQTDFTADAILVRNWYDENPFYLHIVRPMGEYVEIDLAEPQWMKTYADWMRGRSRWYLMRKVDQVPVIVVDVLDGDQPYYTAKHVIRLKGRNAGTELIAPGIGAKRANGQTDRMWVLPTGLICVGDDVESLGDAIIDALQ